jgi:hypothetical protein
VTAVGGTTALTWVGATAVGVTVTEPNRTADAPASAWPVMITVVPVTPREGCRASMEGVTVKLATLVVEPAGSTTLSLPLVAPAGTTTRTDVADSTVTESAATPLTLTLVTVARFVPVIVTVVPMGPVVGVKLVTVGGRITMKSAGLVVVATGVVTVMRPVSAAIGTVVVMDVPSGATLKIGWARVPNFTAVASAKVAPAIVTVAPGVACEGVTVTMRGATRKSAALVTGPAGLATARRPEVAPAGTVTRIEVAETIVTGLALTPLKVTPVTLPRLVPEIVTSVPSAPTVGVKLLSVGALMTTNGVALVAVPPGVVTVTVAVTAAAGTVVVMV